MFNKFSTGVLFVCVMLFSCQSGNQLVEDNQSIPIDPEFTIGQLDNGMHYYVHLILIRKYIIATMMKQNSWMQRKRIEFVNLKKNTLMTNK